MVVAASMIGATLWGVWVTDRMLSLEKREVVTVQLSRIMREFVEAEARAGRPPLKKSACGSMSS
nr:type-F conjugative transfer system protein TrbI [Porphyrobacter sp. HT-58-2]